MFLFTLICTFVSVVGLQAVNGLASQFFVSMTGFSFVNLGNMLEVASSPVAYLSMLVFLIIATFFSIFEISGLIHAYSMTQIGRTTDLLSMMGVGLHTCRRTVHPRNWLIILYLIVLLPITGILTLSSAGYKFSIPYFIIQGIESNRRISWLLSVGYFLLLVIELSVIFAINVYVMEDVSFPRALKRSFRLGRNREGFTLATLFLVTLSLNFLINSVASIIPVNIAELIALLPNTADASVVEKSMKIGFSVYTLRSLLKALIAPPINCAALTVLYYKYVEENELFNRISPSVFHLVSDRGRRYRMALTGAAVLFAAMCFGNMWHYRYLLEPVPVITEVCAHRGDNVHAPENTMPAYQLAELENLPWVETDVIQTKDGVVVMSHDYNLKRVTGHDVEIAESTLEEVQRYPMGDWLPGNYDEDIFVPTLEELMAFVSNIPDMKIQIETKPTDNDINLEEEVVRLIHKYKMEDRSMVISLHGDSIERIREIDPTITTAVCVNIAWAEYRDVPYKNNLSISDNGVTPDLVKTMHDNGIKVFCWTVDNRDDVQYLVSCGVDVIGTNDPLAIEEALFYADYSGGLSRVFHVLMHTIANIGR